MEFELTMLALLFVAGLGAGVVDAIAGGGGLITIPVLMATGMSTPEALATNKLQGSWGTLASATVFIRKGVVKLKEIWLDIVLTFVGAASGAILVQMIDTAFLKSLIPALLIAVSLYFYFAKQVSDEERQRRLTAPMFALLIGGGVGFYDGFLGPGTGAFFTAAFVSLAGFAMAKAVAHAKVLNFVSNFAALIFFIVGGNVVWVAGLVMAVGQLAGGWIGAHLVLGAGTKLIRPLIIVMCLVVSGKMLWTEHAELFQTYMARIAG